jgi:tight adherence protein B
MQRLAQIGGGDFTEALTGAALQRIFTRIQSGLAASWLIRYRSAQPLGRRISVAVRVDGVPGVLTLSYVSPSAPPAPAPGPRRRASQPFWDSTLALEAVVGMCALLLCIAVWVLLRQRSGPGPVTQRVGGFVSTPGEAEVGPPPSLSDAAARRTRATFSKRSWWPAFVEALDIAMIQAAPEKVILYTAMGALFLAALLALVSGSVFVGILPLLAAPFALRTYVQVRVRRQRTRFSDLLPSHLEEVAAAIRAGRSLIEALNSVTDGAEEPVHREFERALADENLGRPLEETLRVVSGRMTSESIEQVAVVAGMHRRTGSSVSEALDRVAEGARERADLHRELRALTAQGRLARWILTFLPPVILLIMEIISPAYVRPLLHTVGGVVALSVAGVMVIAGSLVMKRIVDIEV